MLEKKVTGTQTDKEFEFTWLCRNEDNSIVRNTAKLKNGQKILVDNLPLESTCQIAEKTASIPGYKHSLTWFTNEEKTHAENILSIHPRRQDQRELVITAENTYTPIAQESATFKVSKKVIVHGDKDDNGPINPYEKEFRFRWECIKPNNKKETGNFQTINGASSAPRGSFPIGTQCSITEDAETAHQNGFVHKLTFEASNNIGDFEQISADTAKITLKENGGFELVARNEYTPIVAPVPPTTTSSTAPTTSSSSTPVTTTSSSTPKTTSSSATPTTTISSSTPATTSSSSQAFPPIIPIPIPIPFPPKPAPTVNPPAANTTPTTSSVSASSSVTPSASADSHSGNNNGGMLARTGASVIWMILAALLFASVGTIIICRTRLKKES
ncbi:DUF5979 domain-containing protein [Corynebacterium kutscheri]|uniref:DUF5979 domain-containing protein n=1 Tax=Corynebacterium kutscheri TaxID=35755 RepID=UPI0039E25C4D